VSALVVLNGGGGLELCIDSQVLPCSVTVDTTFCNTLQHIATYCNILQHTATYCNTLQDSATHYNTGISAPHIDY